ncbi:Berardinelli-Seip congenital lipodystrophy 2 (seipin), partial [Nowakowskiella sp. JEL0078]
DQSHEPSALISLDNENLSIQEKILRPEQHYTIGIEIFTPDSEKNLEQGNFMVSMGLYSKNNETIGLSNRPVLLRYKSPLFRSLTTIYKLLPLLLDFTNESQKVREKPVHHAIIKFSNPRIQIYETKFVTVAQFEGLQYFMYHWWLTTGTIFISSFLFWEALFAYLIWKLFLGYYGEKKLVSESESEEFNDGDEKSDDEINGEQILETEVEAPEEPIANDSSYLQEERRRRRYELARKMGLRLEEQNYLTPTTTEKPPTGEQLYGGSISEMMLPNIYQPDVAAFVANNPLSRTPSPVISNITGMPYTGYIPPLNPLKKEQTPHNRPKYLIQKKKAPLSQLQQQEPRKDSIQIVPVDELDLTGSDEEYPLNESPKEELTTEVFEESMESENEVSDYVKNLSKMQEKLDLLQSRVKDVRRETTISQERLAGELDQENFTFDDTDIHSDS